MVTRPTERRRPGLRPASGTWAGCTTRCATCRTTRSTASTTTTSSPSAASTPSPRTSSCRSRTTRSSTARARCSNKMPGDAWQKFANLRLLFGYMYAQPGKKLLFMGDEFGQWHEWNHDASLDWHLLDEPLHQGLQRWVRDLNTALPRRAGPARARLPPRRLRLDRLQRRRAERPQPVPQGAGRRTTWSCSSCNFTPDPAAQLPGRRPARRPLGGDPQQRRPALRRQRPGQHRRRRHDARRLARPLPVAQPYPAAAGDDRPEVDGEAPLTRSILARNKPSTEAAPPASAAEPAAGSRLSSGQG